MPFFARTLRASALALFCSSSFLLSPAQTSDQNARPQFSAAQAAPTAGDVAGFAFSDTQRSGRQDILYVGKPANDNSVTAGLLLNTGASGFSDLPQNHHVFPNVTGAVAAIADMDGDGVPDFVFATSPTTTAGAQLCILYGTAAASTTGAFAVGKGGCTLFPLPGDKLPVFTSVIVSASSSGTAPGLYLADSANGQLYVIAGDGSTGDGIHLSGYAAVTSYPLTTDSGTGIAQLAAGSFKTSVANTDLILQQGSVLVPYVNTGDREHFTALAPLPATPSSALVPNALRLGDLDGDGNADVIALYADPADLTAASQLYVWFGNGDGTFSQPQIVPLPRRFAMASIADMDMDGHADIVLADVSVFSILYNQGGRTFRSDSGVACTSSCAEQQFPAGEGIAALAALDVTGDGKPDVIVANSGQNPAAPRAAVPAAFSAAATRASSAGVTVHPNVSTGSTPVTGSVVANPEPSAINSQFFVLITITPPAGSTTPPGGTVDLSIGGQLVGTFPVQPLANSSTNSAGANVGINANSNTPPGTYPLSAVYSGDTLYAGNTFIGNHVISGNSTTTQLLLCVGPNPGCPASGTFSPLPPYSPTLSMVFGQVVNGAAPVTKTDNNPLTGTITFTDNGTVVCSYTVITGSCSSNALATLQAGQHTIVATYSNDPNHAGSSSQVVITVAPDTTTTTLTGTPNPAVQGTPVTFTITVTGQFAAPTGTFTFSNGGTALGTATLNPTGPTTSTATFTTSTLPVGTDQVSANYAGNQNFLPSGSGSFAEVITALAPASFTLTVGPQALNIGVGNTGAFTVTVNSINGFSAPVTLSCGPLPGEATCIFSNKVVNGGGATTLFLGTTAPHSCGSAQPYFLGANGGPGPRSLALPALAGLFALFLPGRRRWLRSLLMLALATTAIQLTGCGNCTDLATRPGTYHVTVNATSGSGSSGATVSQTITVNVII